MPGEDCLGSGTFVMPVSAAYPNGHLASRTVTAGATSATESFSYDGLGQEVLRQGEDIHVAQGILNRLPRSAS